MLAHLATRIVELERRIEQLLTRLLALEAEIRQLRQTLGEIYLK